LHFTFSILVLEKEESETGKKHELK